MNQTVEKRLDGASVGDWIRNNTNLLLMFALIIGGAIFCEVAGKRANTKAGIAQTARA